MEWAAPGAGRPPRPPGWPQAEASPRDRAIAHKIESIRTDPTCGAYLGAVHSLALDNKKEEQVLGVLDAMCARARAEPPVPPSQNASNPQEDLRKRVAMATRLRRPLVDILGEGPAMKVIREALIVRPSQARFARSAGTPSP
jgi:hypothetical protein